MSLTKPDENMLDLPMATQAEAEAGTDNVALMTPLRAQQHLLKKAPGVFNASGDAPMFACRAWVNFSGVAVLSATYSQSGTTIVVTSNGHGLSPGMIVDLNFTTGSALDGPYVIQSTTTNTYTVLAADSKTTSGLVTQNTVIKANGNVASITDNGTGDYTINFTEDMPDANYAAVVTLGTSGFVYYPVIPTTSAFRFVTKNTAGESTDFWHISVAFFR